MAQSIAKRENWIPVLDLIYKQASKTSILDYTGSLVRETDQAQVIKFPKRTLQGLGTYGRKNSGTAFAAGEANLTWETHTFTQDRGREFEIDSMDNLETADAAFGGLSEQFIREKVAPEIDAYRFETMFGKAGTVPTGADLTAATVKTAIDVGIETMNEAEVPDENRVLFVSNPVYTFMKNSSFFTYNLQSNPTTGVISTKVAEYEGMPVVKVPRTRFYTLITLYDGTTGGQEDGGYIKTATTGRDLNFMIVHKPAILAIVKHQAPRYFSPEVNQDADSHKYQYRIYHDLFVPDNKTDGIYAHEATT